VVDDQVHRHERVDAPRVAPGALHRGAHRRQVDDRGDAGKVLEDHPRRLEGQFRRLRLLRVPRGQVAHVLFGHLEVVRVAQATLQQHLDRKGQLIEAPQPHLREAGEAEVVEITGFGGECRLGAK
jgi:hypothetical protein